MERHLDKRAIAEPLADLFAGLSQSIDATQRGILLFLNGGLLFGIVLLPLRLLEGKGIECGNCGG